MWINRLGFPVSLAVLAMLSAASAGSTAASELVYDISTVAGAGRPGSSGDGRPATLGRLWNPTGVAVDADGSIYIADYKNRKIRKVSTDGILTTFAGTGEQLVEEPVELGAPRGAPPVDLPGHGLGVSPSRHRWLGTVLTRAFMSSREHTMSTMPWASRNSAR